MRQEWTFTGYRFFPWSSLPIALVGVVFVTAIVASVQPPHVAGIHISNIWGLSASRRLVTGIGLTGIVDDPTEQDSEQNQAYWDGLRPAQHCLRYATRDYTARLSGIPYGPSSVDVCRQTPVEIHGKELYPAFCQDLGSWGGVWGHWTVSDAEFDCITYWASLKDEGCQSATDRPYKRVQGQLEGVKKGDHWEIMCATTPVYVEGRYYQSPSDCTKDGEQTVGSWVIDDEACRQ